MSLVLFCLMTRRPPSPTRTDTPIPYTTLFQSPGRDDTKSRHKVKSVNFAKCCLLSYTYTLCAIPLPGVCCAPRSEEHTSELQSLMRISYAVFCLKKKSLKEQTNGIPVTNPQLV